ncbi:PilW family protein [Rubritalea squalenifaciens]|nr:prepilin-type N-terminal cleavage/methylation domain-containing protein [Rubritalea squalenifaciens]
MRGLRKGYTLIELVVVMMLGLLLATTSTMMLSQQVNFYTMLNSQKFVLEEAPVANSMMVRILSQADAFRIHGSQADALSDTNGLVANGSTMVIGFAQPDGSREFGLIEFTKADGASTGTLKFHKLSPDASTIISSWTITGGASNVTFGIQNGILIMTLTGPYGGQIQYAASSSL